MFGAFPGLPGFPGQTFEAMYRAMPVAFIDKQSAEHGDKIIMPPSALERLASLHIEYPMLFKVEGLQSKRHTHCGVLEFIAEEGVVYMPHWMMQNLLLQVGDTIRVRSASLPKGTYVKLQPVTSDFLDITNPKAVLERTLRSYSCLTVGDCFVVNYNNKNYEIEVKDAKPGPAISVIETDCQVDFEAPKDYKEPERVPPKAPEPAPSAAPVAADGKAGGTATGPAPAPEPEEPKFLAFAGTGRRLDGKAAGPTNPVPVPLRMPSNTTLSAGTSPKTGSGPSGSGAGPSGSAAPSGSGGVQKAGTFVNFGPTGNRLEAKLAAKQGGGGTAKPPPPPPQPTEEKKDDSSSNFKAFSGKGYSLKG
ncbi:hypothetical protein VOLCADRAFT_102621 [Volvox carteri f. nagariensis]|uniref:Uncharacterized protein n=1 Tax=Volvox carteri f. nagariensis TaxID=3068 RepID=D8TH41_VOLCA|nr:uncharacterized protein VOLCADRAFT_102621 [Volvox carteri f. nagariensis]EFJ52646.1 hypothetical protein VOLCADRAFT_102621 [Volvox carteri f. nagariensis]|eukprot:XP_002945651.1 hypothetical protein VOLCADRAFT_102621 [Volvox carteri f. nagariensis]